jgi:hypothetical protein
MFRFRVLGFNVLDFALIRFACYCLMINTVSSFNTNNLNAWIPWQNQEFVWKFCDINTYVLSIMIYGCMDTLKFDGIKFLGHKV